MSMPRPEIEPVEADSLASLEERIHRAVELVSSRSDPAAVQRSA